jgi:dihydroflavonol-4-reductase
MILVTGGTGLVGSHLLYKLASQGEKVRAIYRNEKKLANIKNVFSCYTDDYETIFNAIEWFEADILDIPSLTDAFNGINYVYHSAAFVSFEPNKYRLLRKTNIEGTANIVNLCLSNNIKKLCHVSSIATLGIQNNSSEINEESEWNPEASNTIYGITKYGAEMEVWRGSQEGLDIVMVNPGVILGAGIWRYGSGSLFKKAQQGLKYYTSGSIGLVDVEDVVSIMIALTKSTITNERFILVAENWSYKDFLQAMAKAVNAKPPVKLASMVLLHIGWRLDWLRHKLFGKRRQLTKHLAVSLCTQKTYSNTKITSQLQFNFKPVSKSITEIGALYLKQA